LSIIRTAKINFDFQKAGICPIISQHIEIVKQKDKEQGTRKPENFIVSFCRFENLNKPEIKISKHIQQILFMQIFHN